MRVPAPERYLYTEPTIGPPQFVLYLPSTRSTQRKDKDELEAPSTGWYRTEFTCALHIAELSRNLAPTKATSYSWLFKSNEAPTNKLYRPSSDINSRG